MFVLVLENGTVPVVGTVRYYLPRYKLPIVRYLLTNDPGKKSLTERMFRIRNALVGSVGDFKGCNLKVLILQALQNK